MEPVFFISVPGFRILGSSRKFSPSVIGHLI